MLSRLDFPVVFAVENLSIAGLRDKVLDVLMGLDFLAGHALRFEVRRMLMCASASPRLFQVLSVFEHDDYILEFK